MSGICSKHIGNVAECVPCQSTPADLFGKESWERSVAEAKARGQYTCEVCSFRQYDWRDRHACVRCNDSPRHWEFIQSWRPPDPARNQLGGWRYLEHNKQRTEA